MTHRLYQMINRLEELNIWFRLQRLRDDSVMITATLPGMRIEIDVFENGDVEYSIFRGSEAVELDETALDKILVEHSG